MPRNWFPICPLLKIKSFGGPISRVAARPSLKKISPFHQIRENIVAERPENKMMVQNELETKIVYETDYEKLIKQLPLQSKSLHDRIGEMLETIRYSMRYNTQTRHKIT